jgi:DNA-binding transcriptional MerR regulator
MEQATSPAVRIGELSRRLGVSEHVLRAWERRYGILRPQRSAGGYRLYSEADEQRVRRMQALIGQGLSAAEAARAALAETPAGAAGTLAAPGVGGLRTAARALVRSLGTFDEPAAQVLIDQLLGAFTIETVLRQVFLPCLHELGERWARGELSVGQEHFASNLLRGRLAGLARGWGNGRGPQVVLACPPGEQHDIALLAFGIVAHRNGWRVRYLGADTPVAELARVAAELRPDLVVVAVTRPGLLPGLTAGLSRLAAAVPLALGGPGATLEFAQAVGARLLAADPVTEAQRLPVKS